MDFVDPGQLTILRSWLPKASLLGLIEWTKDLESGVKGLLDAAVSPLTQAPLTGQEKVDWENHVPRHVRDLTRSVMAIIAQMVSAASRWDDGRLPLKKPGTNPVKRRTLLRVAIRHLRAAAMALDTLAIDSTSLGSTVEYLGALLRREEKPRQKLGLRLTDPARDAPGKKRRGRGQGLDLEWYTGRIYYEIRNAGRRYAVDPFDLAYMGPDPQPAPTPRTVCEYCPPDPPDPPPGMDEGVAYLWRLQQRRDPCQWVVHDRLPRELVLHLVLRLFWHLNIKSQERRWPPTVKQEAALVARIRRFNKRFFRQASE